jgi:hypothetical protein
MITGQDVERDFLQPMIGVVNAFRDLLSKYPRIEPVSRERALKAMRNDFLFFSELARGGFRVMEDPSKAALEEKYKRIQGIYKDLRVDLALVSSA